jgi:hypothetical protein
MDVLLIVALLACVAWMCVCARQWHRWKAIAALNRSEAAKIALETSHSATDSYNRGYLVGVKTGVASMYRAAARAHASDMAMDVLRMEGHRLVGNQTHDEMETV